MRVITEDGMAEGYTMHVENEKGTQTFNRET